MRQGAAPSPERARPQPGQFNRANPGRPLDSVKARRSSRSGAATNRANTPTGERLGGYASSHDCRVNCGLRSADRRVRRSTALRGAQRLRRMTNMAVARQEAGGRLCAVRAALPGLRQRHRKCVRPRIPRFSPGGLGPHLTSSGFPAGFPPVSRLPAGFSPSPAVPWFPFVRRSPVRSLRPLPGFRFPFPWAISTIAPPAGGSAGDGPGRQGPLPGSIECSISNTPRGHHEGQRMSA